MLNLKPQIKLTKRHKIKEKNEVDVMYGWRFGVCSFSIRTDRRSATVGTSALVCLPGLAFRCVVLSFSLFTVHRMRFAGLGHVIKTCFFFF